MAKEGKEDKLPTLKVTFCPGIEKSNRETLLTQNAKKPGTWFMCKKKKLLLKIPLECMDLFLADEFLDLNPSMKAGVGLFSDISGKIYVKRVYTYMH